MENDGTKKNVIICDISSDERKRIKEKADVLDCSSGSNKLILFRG
jgi:hypothetical protein